MMHDRELVITHLQIIHTWAEFARERDLQFFTEKHLEDIAQWADDALALLKEQEPKQVEAEVINEIDRLYRCPSCHISMILRKQPYCHSCGQALKWGELDV